MIHALNLIVSAFADPFLEQIVQESTEKDVLGDA